MAIRVLMLLTNLQVANGVATYAVETFSSVNGDKIKFDFVLFDGKNINTDYFETITGQGSKVYVLPPKSQVLKHRRECRKILAENHYEIIHDTSLMASLIMMIEAKKYNIPVRILHSHSSKLSGSFIKEKLNKFLSPLILNCANYYLACSDIAGKTLFGKRQYTVVPNLVNENRFIYNETRRLDIRNEHCVSNKMLIGTVGRLSSEKNPFFALNVAVEMKKRAIDFEYWWIGTGPLEKALTSKINEQGLSDHFKLLGEKDDIENYYNALDCLVVPSIFEGFGLSVVEGQACGLPCVISDSIPKETQISDLIYRLSVTNDTMNTWVETICNVANLKRDRSAYNSSLADSAFSISNSGRSIEEIYFNSLSAAK